MAPIKAPKTFGNHGHNFASSGGYGFASNNNGSVSNESISERGWDMSEDIEYTDHDMHDTALAYHRATGDSPDDSMLMEITNTNDIGPDFEIFASKLDTMCSNLEASDSLGSQNVVFETIRSFTQIANSKVGELDRQLRELETSDDIRTIDGVVKGRDTSGQYISFDEITSNIQYWQSELRTWDLFLKLFQHRLSTTPRPDPNQLPADFDHYSSHQRYKDYLLASDPQFKELNIILAWLKKYANSPREMEDVRGVGWYYSKGLIKQRKRQMHGTVGTLKPRKPPLPNLSPNQDLDNESYLVTELDPDAPSRQGKCLEIEDTQAEQRLMRVVFDYLRAGRVSDAMEQCQQLKEYWRAQTLAGGIEAWDKDIDGNGDGPHGVEGNRRRELWRRMCYKLAQVSADYERAVYGILSGDLPTVMDKCVTWEDHLFAHINSLIETKYYNFLASHNKIPPAVQKFPIYDAVHHHGGPDAKFLPRIIDTIQSKGNPDDENHSPQRMLQGSIISGRLDLLVAELNRTIEITTADVEYEPSQFGIEGIVGEFRSFRVIVHILLALKALGAGPTPGTLEWQNAENIISAYIRLLGDGGKHYLIPLYAGQLSRETAIKVVGESLVHVTEERARERLLKLMETYQLDIPATLKHMMSIIIERSKDRYIHVPIPKSQGFLTSQINGINDKSKIAEEDEALIKGLEWLLLVKKLRGEVMRAGCTVYIRFFLTGRLAAAKELLERIPSAILVPDSLIQQGEMDLNKISFFSEEDPLDSSIRATIFIEFEEFIRAISALEDWKRVVRNAPHPDVKRDSKFKGDLEQAYEAIQTQTRKVAENWMIYISKIPEADQIKAIRNTYIPDLILELHNVYVEAGAFLRRHYLPQTLELAALVGSNSRSGQEMLQCLVETGRLKEYVDMVANSSRKILGAAQIPGREMSRRGGSGNLNGNLNIWNVK